MDDGSSGRSDPDSRGGPLLAGSPAPTTAPLRPWQPTGRAVVEDGPADPPSDASGTRRGTTPPRRRAQRQRESRTPDAPAPQRSQRPPPTEELRGPDT